MAPSPQLPRFLSSNPKSRSMRTSIWPVSGEEQLGNRGLNPGGDWGWERKHGLGWGGALVPEDVKSRGILNLSLWKTPQPTCPQDQVILVTSAGKCDLLFHWPSSTWSIPRQPWQGGWDCEFDFTFQLASSSHQAVYGEGWGTEGKEEHYFVMSPTKRFGLLSCSSQWRDGPEPVVLWG